MGESSKFSKFKSYNLLHTYSVNNFKNELKTCGQSHNLNKLGIGHWHLSPKLQFYKLDAPSAYQQSSKSMKTSKKINFIKIVFVSISINRDMVLKWKLGQLVRTDLLPLKRISFSSTHCRSIVQ